MVDLTSVIFNFVDMAKSKAGSRTISVEIFDRTDAKLVFDDKHSREKFVSNGGSYWNLHHFEGA